MNQTPPTGNGQRFTLIALGIVFLAPIIGAWFVFKFTESGTDNTLSNYGDLISPPRRIDDVALVDPGHPGQECRLYGKWNIVYLVAAECDAACEGKLDVMRRIRQSLGADAQRVQRILLVADAKSPGLTALQTIKFPGQLFARMAGSEVGSFQLTETELPLNLRRLYLIDPRGYLMMSYPEGRMGPGIIKDLKRLLKYSSAG